MKYLDMNTLKTKTCSYCHCLGLKSNLQSAIDIALLQLPER